MQREITKKTLLLDKRGKVAQPGWARRMYYIYNRERARRNPVNLKEWNFYQLIKDRMVVQLTIGHVSYGTGPGYRGAAVELEQLAAVPATRPGPGPGAARRCGVPGRGLCAAF